MRIVFVLPGSGQTPVGGFKVVYEYAGGLAARGHTVSVVHPARLSASPSPTMRARGAARYLRMRWTNRYGPRGWFRMNPKVRLLWKPSLHHRHVPDADAIVATAWQTAEWVAAYPRQKGDKLYLIQHLEDWSGPRSRVLSTWKLPLRKIVISRWLHDIAVGLGESATYIPNGLDFNAFGMDVPPEDRSPQSLLMMYHTYAWKGSQDGLEAFRRLEKEVSGLSLTMFGVPARPSDLSDAVTYHREPVQSQLRDLYNRAAIFLAPSHSEGWPLPPAEAMMSGAALVATDIGGHLEYAIHGENALLNPPERPDLLAQNVRRLIEDDELRVRLARTGHAHVGQFTWDRALDRFEEVLQEPYAS